MQRFQSRWTEKAEPRSTEYKVGTREEHLSGGDVSEDREWAAEVDLRV